MVKHDTRRYDRRMITGSNTADLNQPCAPRLSTPFGWVRLGGWHACVAAIRIQQGIVELNRAWASEGLEPLTVRIGIHCDSVLVGNIGSVERMSYTVLGDGVNVAAYMEAANKASGTAICISHAVVREAGHRLCTRPLDQVSVKTRQSAILVHELLGVNDAQPELAPVPDDVSLARLTA